jgi:hypothetical protein
MVELKSNIPIGKIIGPVVVAVFMLWLGWYLAAGLFETEYWDFVKVCVGAFFIVAGLLLIYIVINYRTFYFYDKHMEVYKWGKNLQHFIPYTAIDKIEEIEFKNKHGRAYTLALQNRGLIIKIASDNYKNYAEIKELLANKTEKLIGTNQAAQRAQARIGGVMLAVLGLAIMLIYFQFIYSLTQAKVGQTSAIEATISNDAEIIKGKKGSRYVAIYLDEYPDFKFDLSGNAYKAMNAAAYLQNVYKGDKLVLEVSATDYTTKLVHTAEPGFWVKHLSYNTIDVFALKDANHVYLSREDYEQQYTEYNDPGKIIVLFLGLVLFALGSVLYFKNREKATHAV